MASLYELTKEYLELQSVLESGEDIFTDFAEFVETDAAFEAKAENYAKIIRNFEGEIDALKAEEKRLKDKRGTLEKAVEKLKKSLETAMIVTNKRKFKKGVFAFSIQKNGGALPVIVDVDTSVLPDDLVIITEKPDLKAIANYIEETGDITWAHFGERGESLRIK